MGFWSFILGKPKRLYKFLNSQVSDAFRELIHREDFADGGIYRIDISILSNNPERERFEQLAEDSMSFVLEAQKKMEARERSKLINSRFFVHINTVEGDKEPKDWITIHPSSAPPSNWELLVSYKGETTTHTLPSVSTKPISVGRWDPHIGGEERVSLFRRQSPLFVSRKAFSLFYINEERWFVQTESQGDCMHVQKGDQTIKLLSRKYRGTQISTGDRIHLYVFGEVQNFENHVVIKLQKIQAENKQKALP